MAILKCRMCGGTLEYDQVQDLAVCPYCGSKSTIFHHDTTLYEQFKTQFSALLNQSPEDMPEEGFWVEASREDLIREDGEIIEIHYLTKRRADICTMYSAKHHIIYLFEKEHAEYAARYKEMTGRITYPTPQMEQELAGYVPKLVTECTLQDGRHFLAIEKKENVYPLKICGTFIDRHVAWMVSRMENLCCLLDYNDMVLNALTADNLFIDPVNHQLYLYGGWWFAGYRGAVTAGLSDSLKSCMEKSSGKLSQRSPSDKKRNLFTTDLESIRITAIKLLGYTDKEALEKSGIVPEPFRKFLLGKPQQNARADFAAWDKVLLASYGERKFIPLGLTEEEVYSKSAVKS